MIRNMKTWATFALAAFALTAAAGRASLAQDEPKTTTERIKEKAGNAAGSVKKGVVGAGEAIKNKFNQAKEHVVAMEIETRVYARLHWDKALTGAKIDLSTPRKGVIVLTGTVPDAKAADKAVVLTVDTVGVTEAVNHLTVASSEPAGVK
jgi:osmotically-inducible protein OsmY